MLDRKNPPFFQKSLSFPLINPERLDLSNGSTIYFINGGEQDVIKIECVFKAGKWHEQAPGISHFTANLLSKGTHSKNSFQITSVLDQLGMHLEISPGHDFISISLYGLTKNLTSVIDLFLEIIMHPTFPEDELVLQKNIYIQNLKVNLEKTSYLASRELRESLFGKNHPYGRDATIPQINTIQPSQLTEFHKSRLNKCVILVSGKISIQIKKLLESSFSGIMSKPTNDPVHPIESNSQLLSRKEKKDSVQASIRIGNFVIERSHPDYPALMLVNHILGGYFGSRLMKNIREQKGLTYGISSSIYALKHSSYLTIGADVNKENTDLTIEEIKKEIERLHNELIEVSELETARNHFTGSLQSELSTPFAHADKIKNTILFTLPKDYYHNLLSVIDSLTPDELIKTSQKYLNISSLHTVTIG